MADQDIDAWHNADGIICVWIWPEGVDLAGSAFTLDLAWRGGTLTQTTEAGNLVVDAGARTVTWTGGPDVRVLLPLGRLTEYVLYRRAGGTEVAWTGWVVGRDGPPPTGSLPQVKVSVPGPQGIPGTVNPDTLAASEAAVQAAAAAASAVAPVLPIVTRIRQTTADRTNVTADMIINPALLLTIDAA